MPSGTPGSTPLCSAGGCRTPAKARSLCSTHYNAWRRTLAACSIDDCVKAAKTRGWCASHYERWRVHGDPNHQTWTKICTVAGCEKKHLSGGYCSKHWTRFQRFGDPLAEVRFRGEYDPDALCAFDGCENKREKREWCSTHYRRWLRHGDVLVNNCPKADRIESCEACGRPTLLGYRRFCSSACYAFANRAGAESRDTCKMCGDALSIVLTASGMRKRGNGHGLCLSCAEISPCPQCGGERKRSGTSLVCRPCRRPGAQRDQLLRRARLGGAICEHGDACVSRAVIVEIRQAPCFYCGNTGEHADHFEPLSRGGKHCRENIVSACADCNLAKSDNDPWEWWTQKEAAS